MDYELDTMSHPLNRTDLTNIRADLAIREALGLPKDPDDTFPTDFCLAAAEPIPVPDPYFNREMRRYAKKHKITLEQAFNKITRGRKR